MSDEHGQVKDEPLDPEREARRQFALARIRQYPDPVLRLRANEIAEVDDDVRELVAGMVALMRDANGIGLAANQVGVLRRVFVFQHGDDEEPTAVINPRIVDPSEGRAPDDEGCLSLQRVHVPVDRHLTLTLEGQDIEGEPLRLELAGLDARVVQHELDHLDGVLIIDRTTREARKEALAVLRPQPLLGY